MSQVVPFAASVGLSLALCGCDEPAEKASRGPVFIESAIPLCDSGYATRLGVVTAELTPSSLTFGRSSMLAVGDEYTAPRSIAGLIPVADGLVAGTRRGFWQIDGEAEPRHVDLPMDGELFAMASADLDADGARDLVTVTERAPGIAFHIWQRVGGDYEPHGARETDASGRLFALGDVDGDGRADLLAAAGTPTVHLNADGSRFLTGSRAPADEGGNFTTVALGAALRDADGDGHVDALQTLLATSPDEGHVLVAFFPGDGVGGLGAARSSIVLPLPARVQHVGYGDVTADGVVDLVFSTERLVYVARGRGDGSFEGGRAALGGQDSPRVSLSEPADDGSQAIVVLGGGALQTLTVLRTADGETFEATTHIVPIGKVKHLVMYPDDQLELVLELECSSPCTDACTGGCMIGACAGCVEDGACDGGPPSAR